jgi:multidrug efflux pump subunit AcrA (membrane-fusion protein)
MSIAAALAAGVLQAACSSAPDTAAARQDSPVLVSTGTVAAAERPVTFEVSGTVHARTTAALASRIVAPVLDVRVAPGDRVRAGDVLVTLDSRDLAAGARRALAGAQASGRALEAAMADEKAAQASLRLARATHGRIAMLAGKQSATPQELDEATAALAAAEARAASASARALEATAAVESAKAASETASATESFTQIVAPFDGLVTEKRVESGNMAMPGMPLVVVEDVRGFRLDVRVDESRARDVTTGASVPIVIDGTPAALDAPLDGTVSEVARAVDSGAHTALVKISLPDRPWLRTGMFGRALFSGPARSALTVPAEAIVRRGQLATVFAIEDGVARLRMVNVAGTEVLSGLSAGELVIVNPPAGLVDGQRVRSGGR